MTRRRDQARSAVIGRGSRHRAVLGLALSAGLFLPGVATAAPEGTPDALTALGELVQVMVEPADPGEHGTVDTLVLLGDSLLDVPDAVAVPEAPTGTPVEVQMVAPEGTTTDEAVAVLAAGADDQGTAITGVRETAELPAAESMLALTGGHSLTVLPVAIGGVRDDTSSARFQELATQTSQYWSEQSGGVLAMTTDVRDWRTVSDTGCDLQALWNEALTAHDVPAATETSHVAVYFPQQTECGLWAGMGSIGGGMVWINGVPIVDVFAHEVGHNLGLGHAGLAACSSAGVDLPLAPLVQCRFDEYGDVADVMGYATSLPTGNLTTAFADHLSLAQVRRIAHGETATVDLAPLTSTSSLRSLAIPAVEGTVYVDYRPATGRDVRRPAWGGVQVHLLTTGEYGEPTTYLLDMTPELQEPFSSPALAPGRTWQIPGTSHGIEVLSTGATAQVRVVHMLFTDVPSSHAFYGEIRWLTDRRITTGLGDGSFGAVTPITREAVAAFLFRYANVTGYTPPARARFTDVPVGHRFYTEISWLAEQGITTGLGDGSFGALQPITREAMAAFLFRYARETGYTAPTTPRFPDVPLGHPFYREISWLAERGITTGLGDGRFATLQSTTRQEMAVFLYRLDGYVSSRA